MTLTVTHTKDRVCVCVSVCFILNEFYWMFVKWQVFKCINSIESYRICNYYEFVLAFSILILFCSSLTMVHCVCVCTCWSINIIQSPFNSGFLCGDIKIKKQILFTMPRTIFNKNSIIQIHWFYHSIKRSQFKSRIVWLKRRCNLFNLFTQIIE